MWPPFICTIWAVIYHYLRFLGLYKAVSLLFQTTYEFLNSNQKFHTSKTHFRVLETMDYLAEDTIILIAQKVADHGTQSLFSFMQSSINHLRICRLPAVLRSLLPDHVNAIHDDEIPTPKLNFFHRMIESRHEDFCTVWALHTMYDVEPNVA